MLCRVARQAGATRPVWSGCYMYPPEWSSERAGRVEPLSGNLHGSVDVMGRDKGPRHPYLSRARIVVSRRA